MNITNPSPGRPSKLGISSQALERSLVYCESRKKLRYSLLWGAINASLLAAVLYEIIFTCPIRRTSYVLYIEYTLAILFSFNIMYYIVRYTVLSTKYEITNEVSMSPVQHSPQRISFILPNKSSPNNTFLNVSSGSFNTTLQSWRSNVSMFANSNVSISPTSYSHIGNTPQYVSNYSTGSLPANASFSDSKNESINEEHCLAEYLKRYEVYDKSANIDCNDQQVNIGNTFWSHPVAVSKDTPSFLQRYQYQLSPVSSPVSSSSSPGSQSDENVSPSNINTQCLDMWRRFNVDKITLTRWNANIRTWLSQTIIQRLVKEIENIDDSLQKHGMTDVKVGCVGIERLRKTAETATVLQTIPTLSILLPFLEVFPNQEYFVKRLRELAKGGCLSDFKWNGGSSFHGKEWNDLLPTDSDIIIHLFSTYMDTQLLPNPNNPDVKAFTGSHYLKYNEKVPLTTPSTLAIQQFLEKPPQYRVIVAENVFEVAKGYNNLFHSILFFLYQVNKIEHGMLGRINLGRAGINIMWVIDA